MEIISVGKMLRKVFTKYIEYYITIKGHKFAKVYIFFNIVQIFYKG